jgi:hypothetical protein
MNWMSSPDSVYNIIIKFDVNTAIWLADPAREKIDYTW